jgi:hypothetical protein
MRAVRRANKIMTVLIAMAMALSMAGMGCATKGQTGAVTGAGLGALIGQAIGGNTAGTLIGAGVGTGLGYIIGNEMDKSDAKKREQMSAPPPPRVGLLGGTKWKAIQVTPPPTPPHTSYTLRFEKDGWLHSREVYTDGTVKTDREHYRVEGDTLIINRPGYLVNAKYKMTNNTLTIWHDNVKVVFTLIN